MASTDLTQFAPTSGFRQVFARVATFFATVQKANRNRRAMHHLMDWDARMLRDIGLSEDDVRGKLAGRYADDDQFRVMLHNVSSHR